MSLWQNLPFLLIMLPLVSAAVTAALPPRAARRTAIAVIAAATGLSALLVVRMADYGQSYTYMMGHFPAPWGNEIRAGMLEAAVALAFSFVMLCAVVGGLRTMERDIRPGRQGLYFVMLELTTAALMAQVFTNDVFTGYVFLEIMTIAACALIAARQRGGTLVAATRYMIMNLVGSSLFLLGITLLYDLTGHLLMSNIQQAIAALHETGKYHQPLTMVIGLITVGLCVKSALFPFHTWVPDAYSAATPTGSAVLSSLISKGYIILLVKCYYRVFGIQVVADTGALDVLFVFAAVGAVLGSVGALWQQDIRRMTAYSSVAQIGYIYMAVGLGTDAGTAAAMFQLIAHSLSKALLFIAIGGLCEGCGGRHILKDLRGAGYRAPLAGAAFTLGTLSMIGVPLLSGFMVKLYYARAALALGPWQMIVVLAVLAVSTALNAVYFGRALISLYALDAGEIGERKHIYSGVCFALGCLALCAATVALGVMPAPVLQALLDGIGMLA